MKHSNLFFKIRDRCQKRFFLHVCKSEQHSSERMKSGSLVIRILLSCILLGTSINLQAQSFYRELMPKTGVFSIGAGPSYIYADNGAQYHQRNFEINPVVTISYLNRFSERWALQTSGGFQIIESGGNPSQNAQRRWQESGGAFRFNGMAYFADVMPVFYIIPYLSHMNRPTVNFYTGAGIGLVHVRRTEYFSFDPSEVGSSANITTGYVPVRLGVDFRVGTLSDLSLEAGVLLSFTDYLDGNAGYNKYYDHLIQGQLKYKRFIGGR